MAATPKDEQYLFPRRGGGQPAWPIFLAKPHRRARKKAGLEDFPLHACRRTFGNHCDMMHIPRLVWDGILGHISPTMAELYSGHDFSKERLDCMEKWADRIAAALGENVVTLEPPAAER